MLSLGLERELTPEMYRTVAVRKRDAGRGKDAPRVCLGSPLPSLPREEVTVCS